MFVFLFPRFSSSFFSPTCALSGEGPPPLQALDRSLPRRTPTASQDQSDPRQTSTASARSQCSPPDLNRSEQQTQDQSPAGPQLQGLDRSVPRRSGTASTGSELHRRLRIRVFPAGPEQQAQGQSVFRQTSTASCGSERSPPDLNHKESR